MIDLSQLVTAADKVVSAEAARVSGINAQIAALEQSSMLNRGSREMQIWQLEDEARQYSATYGITEAEVLAGNVYYPKLKALDAEIVALRTTL